MSSQTTRIVEGARPEDLADCTGVSARWCWRHGDCNCLDPEHSLNRKDCPLHGTDSDHVERALKQMRVREVARRLLHSPRPLSVDDVARLTDLSRLLGGPR